MIEIKEPGIERLMKEIEQDVVYGNRTIKLLLQFPEEAQDAATVQATVKSILMCELQEWIRNGAVMYGM